MPQLYGTIRFVKPGLGWGIAQIDGATGTKVLVHPNQKCCLVRTGPAPNDFGFQLDTPHALVELDELVMDTVQTIKGTKAVAWAFRREWDAARSTVPIPKPLEMPAPRPEPVSVPEAPKADPPLTFDEMLEALDWRFLHALLDAMEKKELTIAQLQDFVRNTPKGKRGGALWDAFHKRKSNQRDQKGYGIAPFIKQVLNEAGFLVEV